MEDETQVCVGARGILVAIASRSRCHTTPGVTSSPFTSAPTSRGGCGPL